VIDFKNARWKQEIMEIVVWWLPVLYINNFNNHVTLAQHKVKAP